MMYMHLNNKRFILCLLGCLLSLPAYAGQTLDIETSIVIPGYNDVAVPGNSGTRFSLTEDLVADKVTAVRLRYGKQISDHQWIGFLIAPLTLRSQGTINNDIDFRGQTFTQGSVVNASYRFDSYRFLYRHRLHQSDDYHFSLGGALKIRDASIRLESNGQVAVKDNTGFVPLLSFNITWTPYDKWHFLIDGEALAAPQGRAEDVLFAAQYQANQSLSFMVGYRVLEGGADNDEVYTFSLFHYASAGLTWSF